MRVTPSSKFRRAQRPPKNEQRSSRLSSAMASATVTLGAAVALSGAGCGKECLDNAQFYEQRVFTQVVSKNCIKCHGPEGVAARQNAKFLQLSQAYPAFQDLNLANISEMAKIQYDGKPSLLVKATGGQSHGGGAVLSEGSDEYKILEEMVNRVASPVTCDNSGAGGVVPNIEQLDPVSTLRKATLHLGGRLPTAAEEDAVKAGGDEALSAALDSLMNEETFYTRLKEIYGDVILTGRYTTNSLGLLADADAPGKNWWNPGNVPDNMLTAEQQTNRKWSNYGIGAEPLELVAYVARNNKPFSEILTADYTVVNYQSAKVWGLDPAALGLGNPGDYYSFKPAKLSVTRSGTPWQVPHAGILTTPTFLNRWPTTGTNLNRARARMTLKFFLATDLLAVAERPIDPSSVTSTNPTRDDAYCTSCHTVLDPMASTYQKWAANGLFQPSDTSWPVAMPQPGFGKQVINNVQQYPSGLQWLSARVTEDARFGVSVLTNVYRGLIGSEPLAYPAPEDPDFSSKQSAWQEQNRIFQRILTKFTETKNVKEIFKGLITSAIYRAGSAHDLQPAQMEGFGTGRLLTPELLARKLPATLGLRWQRYDKQDALTTDYNLLYGGIDFDNVTSRLTTPNGIIGSIGQRMANEMACATVAWDFTKPVESRTFFKFVQPSQAPEDDNGFVVSGSVDNIRKNIQFLHKLLLGEDRAIDDPEIERTYKLFLDTWRELHTAKNTGLPYECLGRWDRINGQDLPMAQQINDDKYYTVRSWMAVVTYLIIDWKYLYE